MKTTGWTISTWLTAAATAAVVHMPSVCAASAPSLEPAAQVTALASTELLRQLAPEQTPAADPQDAAAAQVRELASVLADPSATQQQRDEAARRIAARPSPQSKHALLTALQTPQNLGGQIAVARALADEPDPDPEFISPLFAAIGSNRMLTEDATAALANFKRRPEVQLRLIDMTTRRGPEWIRNAAIKALGSSTDKRAAEALMRLLRNPDEAASVRNRAADALAGISGINDYGQDLALWEQWWAAASRRSDADFRDEILSRKASQHDRDQARTARLTEQLQAARAEQYQAAPAEQKEALLLRFLRSDEPAERMVGVDQAGRDFQGTRPVPQSVRDQIRSMIGDSNSAVRKMVAFALRQLNEAPALDGMLQQLTVETDPGVRAELAGAIGKLAADSQQETRAAPVLMRLLSSGSPEVAGAAARALVDVGPQLAAKDPALAHNVAAALRAILDRTANSRSPADIDLRAIAVDALAPLKQHELVGLFIQMLNPREPKGVRISALHALGLLNERQTADTILECLKDSDDDIVKAAIQALEGVAPSADQLEALRPLLDPASNRDASIRDAAWRVIESSLPQMREEDLIQWAQRFGPNWKEPQRLIIVLKQLAAKQTADKKLNALATTQQQIADASLELQPPDLEAAVTYYKLSLDNFQSQNVRGLQLESVIRAYQRVLLLNGKYTEAIAFTQQMLADDPSRQPQLASAIRAHADGLVQTNSPDNLRKASDLIEQVTKMQPPLANQYLSQLEDLRQEINRKLTETSPPATGPRSASGASQPAPATREVKLAGEGN